MTTEKEALRLADEIERVYRRGYETEDEATIRANNSRREAAAMLRKLVAEREADRAAMREALEAAQGLDDAYCRAGTPLNRNERLEDRKRLIAVRAAITHLRQRLGE